MNKKLIAIPLVTVLLAGAAWWAYSNYFAGSDNRIEASGTIEADTVDLSAKTSGTLADLKLEEGDRVKAGEQVARIVRRDLEANRERDQLAVKEAEDKLADLLAGPSSAERNAAAAAVANARAAYDGAVNALQQGQTLYSQNKLTLNQLQQLQLGVDQAKAQLASAEANQSLVGAGNRPDTIAAARDEVERSNAVLKADDAFLEDLKITAPINGVVTTKNYLNGEFVQAGAPVVTLADLNHLWVKVYLTTDQLPSVKLGDPVSFTVSGSSRTFHGKVSRIASQGEFTPKMIQTKEERSHIVYGVKVRIDDGGGILKPGMPADLVFKRG